LLSDDEWAGEKTRCERILVGHAQKSPAANVLVRPTQSMMYIHLLVDKIQEIFVTYPSVQMCTILFQGFCSPGSSLCKVTIDGQESKGAAKDHLWDMFRSHLRQTCLSA